MKTRILFKTAVLTVGALFLLGTHISADELAERGPISFDIYDTNKDDSISEKEYYDARTKRMTIRANEGRPMRNAANAPEFSEFDANKDGKISKVELLEGQNARMQKKRSNRGGGQGKGQGRGQRY